MDDILAYLESIRISELENILIQSSIVSNPHTQDPQKFVQYIQNQLETFRGADISEPTEEEVRENLKRIKNFIGGDIGIDQ